MSELCNTNDQRMSIKIWYLQFILCKVFVWIFAWLSAHVSVLERVAECWSFICYHDCVLSVYWLFMAGTSRGNRTTKRKWQCLLVYGIGSAIYTQCVQVTSTQYISSQSPDFVDVDEWWLWMLLMLSMCMLGSRYTSIMEELPAVYIL